MSHSRTLLLVWIHGFKGTDDTFEQFPKDLRALLAHALPNVDILSATYPQYETRGDLRECVAKFKEWLQNKVIDLEVANQNPSPTVDPSVHVVLCGHSMGGIVAAETLLSIAKDEPVPPPATQGSTNSTMPQDGPSLSTAASEQSSLFFPHVQGVLAFDTPYLGISPGVLAHGAEEQINHASTAYKAFDQASSLFGWGSKSGSTNASAKAVAPAASNAASGGAGWGKWAMYGGAAAAAVAGAAGAAYLSRNQITEGFTWASSHLEFVGCLARGAELQKRVESVVELTRTHDVGFADFYTALDEKVTPKTKYAGQLLGEDRTFCVVPKSSRQAASSSQKLPSSTQQTSQAPESEDEMQKQGEQVQAFVQDPTKSKGTWVKCVNALAKDEVTAHTTMFTPSRNSHYHTMLPTARDRIVEWVDPTWYKEAQEALHGQTESSEHFAEDADGGAASEEHST